MACILPLTALLASYIVTNMAYLSLQCFQSHFSVCEKFAMSIQIEVNFVSVSCVL